MNFSIFKYPGEVVTHTPFAVLPWGYVKRMDDLHIFSFPSLNLLKYYQIKKKKGRQ
jgi:hypothetical protein